MSSKSSRFDGISLAGIANVQTRDAIMKLNKNFNTLLNGVKSATATSGGSGDGEGGGSYVESINGITGDVGIIAGEGISVVNKGSSVVISTKGEDEDDDKEENCNEWSGVFAGGPDNDFFEDDNSWSVIGGYIDDGEGQIEKENQEWSVDDCRQVNNNFS